MFERYTEKARRVIFFARYEASSFGSPVIESEHLLLGILREDKAVFGNRLAIGGLEELASDIRARCEQRLKLSISVDLPLSNEAKRVLGYAGQEAEKMNHRHIGTEHLLLGILCDDNSLTAKLLHDRGFTAETFREEVRRSGPALPIENTSRGLRATVRASSGNGLLPLSSDSMHAIGFAMREAEALFRNRIDPEHLLLGILASTGSLAAELLLERGLTAEVVRERLRQKVQNNEATGPQAVA